jgi:hypothetical protein
MSDEEKKSAEQAEAKDFWRKLEHEKQQPVGSNKCCVYFEPDGSALSVFFPLPDSEDLARIMYPADQARQLASMIAQHMGVKDESSREKQVLHLAMELEKRERESAALRIRLLAAGRSIRTLKFFWFVVGCAAGLILALDLVPWLAR